MPRRPNSAQQILSENAELLARVKLAEHLAAERAAALEALQRENAQLKSDRTHYCERVVLRKQSTLTVAAGFEQRLD